MGMETCVLVLVVVLSLISLSLMVLMSVVSELAQWALSLIWFQTRDHAWWREFSDGANVAPTVSEEVKTAYRGTRIGKYKRVVAAEEKRDECCFCLCDVREGNEFRELRCNHVFHKDCLDRWVDYGRVECPLCRNSLLPKLISRAIKRRIRN